MSDEAADKPKEGEGTEVKKSPSPLVPVLIGSLVGIGATFGVTQFLVLPKMEKTLKAVLAASASAEGGADASGHGAPATAKADSHGGGDKKEKADDHKKKDDSHGGGKDAAKKGPEATQTKDGWNYPFAPVSTNIAGTAGSKYIRCGFIIVSDDKNIADIVEENKGRLKDEAISILGSRTIADIETPGAKNTLRAELATQFNKALSGNVVKAIQLTDFLIQ